MKRTAASLPHVFITLYAALTVQHSGRLQQQTNKARRRKLCRIS